MSGDETLRVGMWTADRMGGRLSRPGEARPVEPKVMELLFLLASERSRVFGHGELRAALWPNTIVGDDSLARCVSKLRRALADADGGENMIETIPKRGYRLRPDHTSTPQDAPDVARRPSGSWLRGGLAAALLLAFVIAAIATTSAPRRAAGVSQADVDRAKALSEQDAARQAAAR